LVFVKEMTNPIVWGIADPVKKTSRMCAEEAASICIAAIQKDWRGRTRTDEPAGIHRSSFWEGKGGGLDSFILVPM
jgi:hypothetical protein